MIANHREYRDAEAAEDFFHCFEVAAFALVAQVPSVQAEFSVVVLHLRNHAFQPGGAFRRKKMRVVYDDKAK